MMTVNLLAQMATDSRMFDLRPNKIFFEQFVVWFYKVSQVLTEQQASSGIAASVKVSPMRL